jgi:putative molybdopterin biosynthesis protein
MATYTPEEAADRLSVSLSTIYRLVKAGQLKAARVGRQLRFTAADLDEYLRNNGSNGFTASNAGN